MDPLGPGGPPVLWTGVGGVGRGHFYAIIIYDTYFLIIENVDINTSLGVYTRDISKKKKSELWDWDFHLLFSQCI